MSQSKKGNRLGLTDYNESKKESTGQGFSKSKARAAREWVEF